MGWGNQEQVTQTISCFQARNLAEPLPLDCSLNLEQGAECGHVTPLQTPELTRDQRPQQPWNMASPEHPGSPGWTGPMATGPECPHPGPEGHLDAQDSQCSHSSMTTRELQEYWWKERGCWKHVKRLFEITSAPVKERKVSKFVVSRDQEMMACLLPPLS
ncbi:hypothetical protein MC885_012681 [Smutsia gigantea]|nr:hypothetical protein MC885_012681 [Smutsia gigantea]